MLSQFASSSSQPRTRIAHPHTNKHLTIRNLLQISNRVRIITVQSHQQKQPCLLFYTPPHRTEHMPSSNTQPSICISNIGTDNYFTASSISTEYLGVASIKRWCKATSLSMTAYLLLVDRHYCCSIKDSLFIFHWNVIAFFRLLHGCLTSCFVYKIHTFCTVRLTFASFSF
jgi:hypothetical protein